jgi:hypothetical protein
MMKLSIIKIMLLGSIFLAGSAHAFKAHDVLTCGLPDGSEFVLRATYDYYPDALPHGAKKVYNQPFKVFFKSQNHSSERELDTTIEHVRIDDPYAPDTPSYLCAENGESVNGLTWISGIYFFQGRERKFIPQPPQDKMMWVAFNDFENNSEYLKSRLRNMNLRPVRSVSAPVNEKRFVQETALANKNCVAINPERCKITAVYKNISIDSGKTWIDPTITTDAEIFELGKSILEQCFIARPISINGRKIEAKFPLCRNQAASR